MDIPFHKPILPKDVNTILHDSINSGWLTTGPKVKEFEDELSLYLESKHVIAVNSCTAALHLALAAKQLSAHDRFIAPTYTFVASVEVGEYFGSKPVLVDCDRATFNLDLNQVEDALRNDKNRSIKVIIPVHFAGQSVDMLSLQEIAQRYGVFLLEDAAHALETKSDVGKIGNSADAVAFSFYANKNITTGGEGGALATNNDEIAEAVRKLSLHGISKDGWKRFAKGGNWRYDVSLLGYKYNMTDIAASFGREQLSHIQVWHARRLAIVSEYTKHLS